MRYFHVRDGIIENCSLWDGKTPFDPGPDVQMIPEAELPGLHIGDRVSGDEPERLDSPEESDPDPDSDSEESESESESESERGFS